MVWVIRYRRIQLRGYLEEHGMEVRQSEEKRGFAFITVFFLCYMYECFANIHVCVLCTYLVLLEVRKHIISHGTKTTDDCELSCGL